MSSVTLTEECPKTAHTIFDPAFSGRKTSPHSMGKSHSRRNIAAILKKGLLPFYAKILAILFRYDNIHLPSEGSYIAGTRADLIGGAVTKTAATVRDGWKSTMFCKYCGAGIGKDSVFCNKCGKKQS